MSKQTFSFKDKYGSYTLSIEKRIICAHITGAIGLSLCNRYNRDFSLLVEQIGTEPWGHYGDFRDCEALTTEAKQLSIAMHDEAVKKGCVVSAYQMSSALLVNQFNYIRQSNELAAPVNQRIFASKDECIGFIENYLQNVSPAKG